MANGKKRSPIDPREELFISEYLKDFNGTQAAIRAGYATKGAKVQASRLLTRVNVQQRIEQLQTEIRERNIVSVERVLAEFARIGYMDARKLCDAEGNPIPLHQLDDDIAACVVGVDVQELWKDVTPGEKGAPALFKVRKYRLADKNRALDSMARHLGLFKDTIKLEVSPIRELMEYVSANPKPLPAKP